MSVSLVAALSQDDGPQKTQSTSVCVLRDHTPEFLSASLLSFPLCPDLLFSQLKFTCMQLCIPYVSGNRIKSQNKVLLNREARNTESRLPCSAVVFYNQHQWRV